MANLLTAEPELLDPIDIIIESIDKVSTPYSGGVNGTRGNRNHVVRTEFTIPAQVVFGNVDQKGHSTPLGMDEEAKGYVIIRPIDLFNLNKTIKRGDRIIKMENRVLDQKLYFVHSVNDLSSHFSNLGFTFIRMVFMDRDPVG